jgi:D-alanyl-D-alanine carboxypeptidase/D-alanyl-D-alanine carboxypeptidase (penicillin-binding protein 5/6)
MDAATGYLLFEKNADEKRSMASTTKIMTTLLVLEQADLQQEVVTTKEMVTVEGSGMGLLPEDRVTFEGLCYGMMLSSGNDAANTAAIAHAGSLSVFEDKMNAKAAQIGMKNTHFVTPDGYHDWDHYISIRGYMIIARLILEHELLSSIVKTPQATITYHNKYGTPYTTTMRNTNRTLHADQPELYRPEAVGLKTGSTSAAGKCLLTAYQLEGGYLIVGVFGCIETTSRFTSANTLFDFFMAERGAQAP